MLNLQVVSDLHFELYTDAGFNYVEAMDPEGVDILVLNGDVLPTRFFTQTQERVRQFAAKFKRVIIIPGNHEFWGLGKNETFSVLSNAVAGLSNVSLLNNQLLTIDGRRFLGGTMWFPKWKPIHDYAASQLPDFREIVNFKDWVVEENKKFQTFLKKNLQEGDIVLTHYLPSFKSVVPMYRGSPLNSFFVCEMDQLISERKPALWIHGHTHFSLDYQISRTRIVCNPRGNPGALNADFIPKLLIPTP